MLPQAPSSAARRSWGGTLATQSPWIEVGALATAFERDSFALPTTDHLVGRELTLHFEDLAPLSYRFLSGGRVRYGQGSLTLAAARITSIRPDIFLIDHPGEPPAHGISLVLDLNGNRVWSVTGRLPSQAEALRPMRERFEAGLPLSAVSAVVRCGNLGGEFSDTPICRSDDLIGLHNRYVYSPHEVYDHIYLNHDCYLWHCIRGAEAGLADVDRCETYRIADGLYLFFWCEKIVPTLGLVLIDLDQRRTDGRIMGYRDGRFAEVASFPMGARITPMTRVNGLGRVDE